MPIRCQIAETIAAPPDRVFAIIDDLPQTAKWLPPCVSLSKVGEGPNATGDKLRYVYKQGGRQAEMEGIILSRVPGSQLVCRYGDRAFEVLVDLQVEAAPGGALATHTIEISPKTFLGKLMSPLIRLGLVKQTRDAAANLKRLVEGTSGSQLALLTPAPHTCSPMDSAMPWIEWYNALAKPTWTPAPATIGLIWSILYSVIAISFAFVFVRVFQGKAPRTLAVPFAVNLIANLLFMLFFSGLRSLPLAAVDIVIVWSTIIWCMVAVWRHYRWVAVAQVPYFVWVSIATVLQMSITWMNWGRP